MLLMFWTFGCGSVGGARKLSRLELRTLASFGKLARVEQEIVLPASPQSLEIENTSQKWQAAIESEFEKASTARDELRAQKSGTLRLGYLVGKTIADSGLTESLLLLSATILGESFLVEATNQQGGKLSRWLEWRLRYDHDFGARYPALKTWADSRSGAGQR